MDTTDFACVYHLIGMNTHTIETNLDLLEKVSLPVFIPLSKSFHKIVIKRRGESEK